MTRKTENEAILHGHAKHRRTQSDYMVALLDRVTTELWDEVIDATIDKAKEGDAQARAWLAHYLIGRPRHEAPEPLAVMAQRIGGDDPLVARLAKPAIDRLRYPYGHQEDDEVDAIKALFAAELPEHIEP